MRGKEFTNGGRAKSVGITPAYAGKRIKEICVSYEYGDHPRLCGEKLNSGSKCKFQSGSPPPMRGKGRHCQIKILCHGITPAYAGKRVYLAPARLLVRDHPRLCGEKDTYDDSKSAAAGSPPPMRGKDDERTNSDLFPGITPAYAGKSLNSTLILFMIKDHPRLCGEKFHTPEKYVFTLGSPPPMRGKASKQLKPFLKDRITPAYAGKRWRVHAQLV